MGANKYEFNLPTSPKNNINSFNTKVTEPTNQAFTKNKSPEYE